MLTPSSKASCLRLPLCALAAITVIFVTGCSLTSTAPATDSFASATGALAGKVHGGQFPIYNSTVTLYAAGATGYGSSGGASLAHTTTDLNGNWSLPTYTCPVSNPVVYLIASGGNTQGTGLIATNNTAAVLMAVVGRCNSPISSTVIINEITTAASVFALAQYINPGTTAGTETMGTSSSTQGGVGIVNAASIIPNLANLAYGATPTTPPTYTGTNASVTGVTVTATAEYAKIITIANILASCINSATAASTTCVDLMANALPPPNPAVTSQPTATFGPAVDTLQAAYYMAVNPIDAGTFTACTTTTSATTAIGCLFNLASSNPPFQTGLSSQPTDWTIGVNFTATGACTHDTPDWPFFNGPAKVAVDGSGNLWFINGNAGSSFATASPFGGITPYGKPIACNGPASGDAGAAGAGIAVDPSGNIWASFSGPTTGTVNIYELNASVIATNTGVPTLWETPWSSFGLTIDGNGNVFFSSGSHSTPLAGGQLYEFPNPGSTLYTTATGSTYSATATFNPTLVGTNYLSGVTTATQIDYMAPDHTGNIWMVNNTNEDLYASTPTSLAISSYSIASGNVVTFYTTTAPPAAFTSGQTFVVTGLTSTNGLVIDHQGFTVSATTTTTPYTITATLITTPPTGTAGTPNTGIPAYPTLPTASQTTDTGILTGYTDAIWAEPSTSPIYGMAVDSNGYLYTGTVCCAAADDHALIKITPNATVANSTQTTSAPWIGGDNGIRALALDGADNIWFGSVYPELGSAAAPTAYGIGEAYATGSGTAAIFTNLSPNGSAPATCSSSTQCPSGGGFQKASFLEPYDIAVDPSGNVWVPNTGASTTSANSVNYAGTSITQVVGAAVPVVTPIAVAAANGTQATKP